MKNSINDLTRRLNSVHAWILENLEAEDQEEYLRDISVAISGTLEENCFAIFAECFDAWEATAEMNSIPGAKEQSVKAYNQLKRTGIVK